MSMVKVKICGITRPDDARLASELGASAIGMVFWDRSPRRIDPTAASAIVARLPLDVVAVGVFVNATHDTICAVADHVGLGAIQLHGDEPVDFCETLPYRVMKAIPLRDADDLAVIDRWPRTIDLLVDTHDPTQRGGTGRVVDWTLAAAAARRRPLFLAGGLRPDNVAEAVNRVRPYGVDASSGLEAAPGRKDAGKLRAFFAALDTTWQTPHPA